MDEGSEEEKSTTENEEEVCGKKMKSDRRAYK